MNDLPRSIGLDNVGLVPRIISHIRSRETIDTSVVLNDDITLALPIIASPMKDVCDGKFGAELIRHGCYGIIHRFCSIAEQLEEFGANKDLAVAIGTNGDSLDRFRALSQAGCKVFCVDVANGANTTVEEFIHKLLGIREDVSFIVGNVASKETFEWLCRLPNVIGVRVGIAGGLACTTKDATGIFHPMASLLMECASVSVGRPLIIADGGIKTPSHFCKAIALGAHCVMLGSVLAAANDSPAELMKQNGRFYKTYHGSASFEIQTIYREKPKYIEGKTSLLDFENESLSQILARFSDGLRSSMSYMNAKNIGEYRNNASFTIID